MRRISAEMWRASDVSFPRTNFHMAHGKSTCGAPCAKRGSSFWKLLLAPSLAVLCTSDRHPGVRLEEQEVACSQAQRLSVYLT